MIFLVQRASQDFRRVLKVKKMTRKNNLILRIASHFLQHPDEEMINSTDAASNWISGLPPGRAKEVFTDFLANLNCSTLVRLQEEYSRIFDFNPATCLNLTYHKYGDKRERGAALAALNRMYRQAGYEPAVSELPDFLPLILEFMSVCSGEECTWIVNEYGSELEKLSARMQAGGSRYAHLMSVVLPLL